MGVGSKIILVKLNYFIKKIILSLVVNYLMDI